MLLEANPTQNRMQTLNRRKILVVEDDRDMAQLTRYLIERYAVASCDIVTDSYEAIEAFCTGYYDSLVVDQNLPGLRGIEVLRQLDRYLDSDPILGQQIRFSKKIPVVMISGQDLKIPNNLNLTHFEITDRINKADITHGLAKNFAS